MKRNLIRLAGLILVLGIARNAPATTISYEVSNIAGNTWEYTYSVANDTLGSAIAEFTIWFGLDLYENLALPAAPAGWDPIVIQPVAGLLADGFYDALALVSPLGAGASLGGFSVQFDYLGSGTPGSQPFDIVDPVTLVVLDSGQTVPAAGVPVPEPGTLLLGMAGVAGLFRLRKRTGDQLPAQE